MNNIVVLMSTYNGKKFLAEQIQSILEQTEDLMLIIRDDGSTDGTQEILNEYKNNDNRVSWYQGNNIGFCKSFLTLLYNAPEADYYAFADQDDYWNKEKLSKAINLLKKEEKPAVYCSNLTVADEKLNPMYMFYENKNMNTTLERILWDNIAPGCTMVFNRDLANIVKKYKPDNIKYHDWWIMMLASLFGKIIYDPNSYIKYRQHGDNLVGKKQNKYNLKVLKRKIFKDRLSWNLGCQYYQNILYGYSDDLNKYQREILNDLLSFDKSYISRYRLIFNSKLLRDDFKGYFSLKKTIYRKILIIFGIK